MKYANLYELMESESPARAYFDGLPEYVQSHIQTRADHVNSIESLRDYAENLLRGDQ